MPTETKTYLHGDKDPPDLAYLFSWWQYFLSDRKENVWAAKCRRSALTRYAKASLSFFLGNDTEYLCCQGNLKLWEEFMQQTERKEEGRRWIVFCPLWKNVSILPWTSAFDWRAEQWDIFYATDMLCALHVVYIVLQFVPSFLHNSFRLILEHSITSGWIEFVHGFSCARICICAWIEVGL